MTVQELTDGTTDELIAKARPDAGTLEVIDGRIGWLKTRPDQSPESATRVAPGDTVHIESAVNTPELLEAAGSLTYQFTFQEPETAPRERVIRVDKASVGVARPLARAVNTSPGATADVFSSDVEPPETGTMNLKVQVASDAAVRIVETIDGTAINQTINNGSTLDAGEVFNFTYPVRGDATYNVQPESDVEMDIVQVDYSRDMTY